MTEPDIKALLGKAVEDEPPLRIDREEVFRAGRRRLRNRRFLEAGSVVGAVVVAVVGAFALSGVGGDGSDGQVPPATASTTGSVETSDGLELPLPEPTTTEPSYQSPPDVSFDRAAELSEAYLSANLLPSDVTLRPLSGETVDPLFVNVDNVYKMTVDLVGADHEGSLEIEVAQASPNADPAACSGYQPVESCEVTYVDGVAVAVVLQKFDDGEKCNVVFAVRPDGTRVTATSTNQSSTDRAGTKAPVGDPLADKDVLTRIVTLPGLVYG